MKKETTIKKLEPVFSDARGDIFDLIEDEVHHVGLITCTAGSVRGNHYHKKSTQYTYVVEGRLELFTKDAGAGEEIAPDREEIQKGDMVVTPPGIIHTLRALTDSVILDATTESRKADGYEGDTIRVPLEI